MKIKVTDKTTRKEFDYDNVTLIVPTSHYLKIWASGGWNTFDIPYKNNKIQIINDNDEWRPV